MIADSTFFYVLRKYGQRCRGIIVGVIAIVYLEM